MIESSVRRTSGVLLFAAALLLGAGCSTERGVASPIGTPGPATSLTGGAPSSSATSVVQPCTLLSMAEIDAFGDFGAATKVEAPNSDRACSWEKKIDQVADSVSVTIFVRDTVGIDQAQDPGGGVQKGDVNGRRAVQLMDTDALCATVMPTGPSSRVDVVVLLAPGKTVQEACTVSGQVARVVEPKLPK